MPENLGADKLGKLWQCLKHKAMLLGKMLKEFTQVTSLELSNPMDF